MRPYVAPAGRVGEAGSAKPKGEDQEERLMLVETTIDDGVAIITINRPERKNAITLAMRTDIEHAFLKAQDDEAVRVIVFTGAGGDFSAGADVSEMGGGGVNG
jgi:2-(1,2-epoxy-1,2-dihydrophenyl)acetyl-CoA isomerase